MVNFDIFTIIGLIFGLSGIILSIIFYLKGIDKKDPRYFYRTYKVVSKLSSNEYSSIRIFYGNKEVIRIFTTYVWIWNDGKKPITNVDIPQNSNITLSLIDEKNNPEIIDYKVVRTSRREINFEVNKVDDNELSINFNFLDKNDGVVLEIQHTGSTSTFIETKGIILGSPDGLREYRINKIKPDFMRKIIFSIANLDRILVSNTITFYSITSCALISIASLTAYGIFSIYNEKIINTTSSRIIEAVRLEFPLASTDNLIHIIENLNNTYPSVIKNIGTLIIFSIGLIVFLFIGYMVIFIARRDFSTPYPKSLKLAEEISKHVNFTH